jgi:hypothetical protein
MVRKETREMKRGRRWRLATAAIAGVAALAAIFATARPAAAVVGGVTVSRDSYPYLVHLQASSEECHGAVISDSWILTAAHCFIASDVSDPGSVTVAGATLSGSGGDYVWQPVQIVLHPLWDGNQDHGHDLALMRVASGALAPLAPVQVGTPWDAGAYAAGLSATIMGDSTIDSINGGGTVTVAQVPLQSDSYMASLGFSWINALMIGAGSPQQTTCYGDSGGPLVVTRNSLPVEVGVVSFGNKDCTNAAGFSELSGPQLAWVASSVPSITSGWGACTASDGNPGRTVVYYGPTNYAGTATDGPNYWSIACQIIGVTVPNVLGMDQYSAEYTLSGGGLSLGTVSYHYDCYSPGDVEIQNPTGGAVVSRGTAVSITVSACSSGSGGGDTGGDTGGGDTGGGILPK